MIIAITVTGKDRPGIISALTAALYDVGGNLEDASMTILEGEFAMIFLAELRNKIAYAKFRERLGKLERSLNLVISVKEVKHRLVRGEKHEQGTEPWVVSVLGKDRAGIVYFVSKVLADHGLNITDLNSKILGRGRKSVYTLILEVDVPKRKKVINQLRKKFRPLEKKMGVTVSLNPVDLAHF